MRSLGRWLAASAVFALTVSLPVAAALVVRDADADRTRAQTERLEHEDLVLGVVVDDGAQSAAISAQWIDATPAEAILPAGLISAVFLDEGSMVRLGDPVVAVDGVVRIAHTETAPFYRDLRWGDTGDDVRALHRLLVATGTLETEPDDPTRFGGTSYRAVVDLERSLGAAVDGIFERHLAVFIPEPASLARIEVRPGDQVLGGWTIVGTSAPVVTGFTVELLGSDRRQLLLEETTLDVSFGELTVMALSEDVQRGDDAGIISVLHDATSPDSPVVEAFVRRSEPLRGAAVPSISILRSGDRTCVAVAVAGGYEVQPIETRPSAAIGIEIASADLIGSAIVPTPVERGFEPESCT